MNISTLAHVFAHCSKIKLYMCFIRHSLLLWYDGLSRPWAAAPLRAPKSLPVPPLRRLRLRRE